MRASKTSEKVPTSSEESEGGDAPTQLRQQGGSERTVTRTKRASSTMSSRIMAFVSQYERSDSDQSQLKDSRSRRASGARRKKSFFQRRDSSNSSGGSTSNTPTAYTAQKSPSKVFFTRSRSRASATNEPGNTGVPWKNDEKAAMAALGDHMQKTTLELKEKDDAIAKLQQQIKVLTEASELKEREAKRNSDAIASQLREARKDLEYRDVQFSKLNLAFDTFRTTAQCEMETMETQLKSEKKRRSLPGGKSKEVVKLQKKIQELEYHLYYGNTKQNQLLMQKECELQALREQQADPEVVAQLKEALAKSQQECSVSCEKNIKQEAELQKWKNKFLAMQQTAVQDWLFCNGDIALEMY